MSIDAAKVRGHFLPAPSFVLSLAVGAWFVSFGDGSFLTEKPLRFSSFYDAQGDSMLQGELSVPCSAIGAEAFVVEDRCYGYFGITPSLLRIPLNLCWPRYRGRWAPLSVLAASGFFLALAYVLTRKVRRHLFPDCPDDLRFQFVFALFLLALGLGSTNIFLLSRPVVYHEASIWSVSFALAAVVCAFEYWQSERSRWLWGAGIAGLLAINSRPVAGAVSLAACALAPILRLPAFRRLTGRVPLPKATALRDTLLGATLTVLSFGSYLAVNHAKFGAFEAVPIGSNRLYNARRLAKIDGSMLHLSNLGWNLRNYFGLAGIAPRFTSGRVSRAAVSRIRHEHPRAKIDIIEPYMSVAVAMSALMCLAVLGTASCMRGHPIGRGFGIISACTMAGPILMLFYAAVSYRYFHEYLLWFGVAGAAGVSWIRQRFLGPAHTQGWLVHSVLTLLVTINIVLNIEFALRYQLSDTNVGRRIPAVSDKVEKWKSLVGLAVSKSDKRLPPR